MHLKFVSNVKFLCQLEKKVLNTKLNRYTYRYFKLNHSIHKNDFVNPLPNTASQEANKSTLEKSKPPYVEDWSEIAGRYYSKYQQFVGILEVLEAQEKVTLFTNQLFEVQSKRRQLQRDVESVHQQLLSTHQRITKSELYSEDHYSLFEKARELNGNLKILQGQFSVTEEEERTLFTQLTTAIKYCHEKERTQSEQSKYWSILISVISASLASLITSINNWVRIKEIKDHATLLHKDTMDKTDLLYNYISNNDRLGDSSLKQDSKGNSFSTESFLETIRSTVRNEVKHAVHTSTEAWSKEGEGVLHTAEMASPDDLRPVQEPSYAKIGGSMLIGAALGIGMTAFLLGSSGGGGGGGG